MRHEPHYANPQSCAKLFNAFLFFYFFLIQFQAVQTEVSPIIPSSRYASPDFLIVHDLLWQHALLNAAVKSRTKAMSRRTRTALSHCSTYSKAGDDVQDIPASAPLNIYLFML